MVGLRRFTGAIIMSISRLILIDDLHRLIWEFDGDIDKVLPYTGHKSEDAIRALT